MKRSSELNVMFVVLLLVCATSLSALEPVKLSESPIDPVYLVPVNPDARRYEAAIEELFRGRMRTASMIYSTSPYAGKDFGVCVSGKDFSGGDANRPGQNFITVIQVAPEEAKTLATVKKKVDVPIDGDFAIAVQRAWASMLLKTRYPTNHYQGVDGSRVEFSVFVVGAGMIYGQLWSPSQGLPKDLMDLGFALADYCETTETERIRKREELMKRLQDFEKRVAKTQPL